TIGNEPPTYKAVDTPCRNQDYAPFIAPSQFIRAHASGGSAGDSQGMVGGRTGLNTNGAMGLFVRSGAGIEHIFQENGGPNGGWSNWSSLGGPPGSNPVVGQNADGRLEIFVVGSDGNLHHLWQLAPHGAWTGAWSSLGGGNLTGEPAVALNTNGSLEVFVRRNDGSIVHIWEQSGTPSGWSGFASLGGSMQGSPAVARNADGRLEVFARGTDGALWHVWQNAPHADWHAWDSFGGSFSSDPEAVPNADGRLQVSSATATTN